MTDESCSGFVNWDSFYVGSLLENVESLNNDSIAAVRGAADLTEAAAQLKGRWDGFDWNSEELDLSKVDWEDVAQCFYEEED
jgi:hypothetical protein